MKNNNGGRNMGQETGGAGKSGGLRDAASGVLAILFYLLFIAFSWYAVYMKSLDFYTGKDTGIPGNPEIIPSELVEPTIWSVIWALAAMTLYAFVTANPDRALGHAGERLARQDLRTKTLPERRHFWTFPWWMQAVLLAGFSWFIRMKVVDLIGQDTIQIVDFERAFYVSLQDAPVFADVDGINFYRAFPNWALHVKLLHLLNVNFGGEPLTGILWNAAVSSLSVALLYLIVYFSTNKDVLAVISALIFSCWPFSLYYMILLTPDFNFIFFCLLGLLFVAVAYRFAARLWIKLCLYGLAGATLSVAGFFKSIDKVLIIALFLAAVLAGIALGKWERKRAVALLLCTAVFFTVWWGTGKLVYRQIEDYVGGTVNSDVAPYFMNVGMNWETYGQWSQDVLDEYLDGVRETDYDFEAVNEQMRQRLKERIEEGPEPFSADWWEFFDIKLQKGWANNEGIRFIMQTINPENEWYDMAFYEEYYAQIQAYQVVVAFLMALGGAVALLVRDRKIVFVCALMVFGFALLLLISEVQPRYKTVVFPFMAVVAAYGIYGILRPLQLIVTTGFKRIMRRK